MTATPCACGQPATANGRECPGCFKTRIGSVGFGVSSLHVLAHDPSAVPKPPKRHVIDRDAERKMQFRLDHYKRARDDGIQPATTRVRDVDRALRATDATETPFRADRASLDATRKAA